VSIEEGTVFSIEVSEDKLSRLNLLVNVPGFDAKRSNTAPLKDRPNYFMYTAIYNRRIRFREERRIKKSINKLCGKVDIDVLRFGEDPILSKDRRDMLIASFAMAGVAFFSTLAGVNVFLPGKFIEALYASGITAAFTFCTELYIELKIRQHSE
jgi:hypothetical protein